MEEQYDEVCHRCGGSGVINTCWDDMCHGPRGCIHGDGEQDCPNCEGSGETLKMKVIPFEPESIESMKARFPKAIEDLIESSEDTSVLDPKHRFDFNDGYRLVITRDKVAEGEFIVVCGGPFKRAPYPVTLVAARVGINFTAITDGLYGDGEDVESPATAPLPGASRIFKHECTFTVICCSGDARGDEARRRGRAGSPGVYKMITDVKNALDCIQFRATLGAESVLLNPEPFKPAGIEYIARLPELTAYAVHFDTYFKYATPDRTAPGELVQELIFEVEHTYPKGSEGNLPGVVLR